MAGIVLADVGADLLLEIIFNDSRAAGGDDLTLSLYTNNYVPLDTSVAGDFTEAAGGGYAAVTLTMGSWTVAAGNDPSDAVYAEQTWTFTGTLTGAATIYGYFVVDADGTLLFAEKFDYSFTPAKNGDQLRLTPAFQLSKGTPS
jgi:hypothetical protein